MEVRITPDGEIIMNITNGDGQAAFDLIQALQNKVSREKSTLVAKDISVDIAKAAAMVRQTHILNEDGDLNQVPYRTWSYLVENDRVDGVHVSEIAKAFGIGVPAANTRLLNLLKAGYAKRIHRGYYRACTPPGDTSNVANHSEDILE